jgi:16S rRNA (guanine527-N7)-methyltransferase
VTKLPDLVRSHGLDDLASQQLAGLVKLIADDEQAPTTVRDPPAIVRDHLADSLIALDLEPVRSAQTIADLGAGAGFPGLPLAIALPRSSVHLVESNRRKAEFLGRAITATPIPNAHVVPARAEEWAAGAGACDLVVARALAALPVVAEYAAPLLAPGGMLLVWRGRRDGIEEGAAVHAASILGLDPLEPIHVVPYRDALHRHLHPFRKIAPTPARFPRRPGVARKRPLM